MNQRVRIRGAALLCCHCVRNAAYYRAGWVDDDFVSDEDFWRNVNSNFLDTAVMEWCKVFADQKGKHHWRKVLQAPDGFLPALFQGINVSEDAFNTHSNEMRVYRDKFLAHLDEERVMHVPRLGIVIDSAVFLYGLIRHEYQQYLPDAPRNLRDFYTQHLEYAQRMYPDT